MSTQPLQQTTKHENKRNPWLSFMNKTIETGKHVETYKQNKPKDRDRLNYHLEETQKKTNKR